jgi:predicted transcriptional regulator
MSDDLFIHLTADIVAAHVSNNAVASGDLAGLIERVFTAVSTVAQPPATEPVKQEPAVSIRASIKPDYLICLEDGVRLKMLKRHLQTHHSMTPGEYRAKWGLLSDYPMVAPNASEKRGALAKVHGFGRKKAVTISPVAEVVAPAAKRGAGKAKKAVAVPAAAPVVASAPAAKPARKPRAKKAAASAT